MNRQEMSSVQRALEDQIYLQLQDLKLTVDQMYLISTILLALGCLLMVMMITALGSASTASGLGSLEMCPARLAPGSGGSRSL